MAQNQALSVRPAPPGTSIPDNLPPAIHALAVEAAIYVQSGLLPASVNTWQKAVLIMQQGRELGWGPMASLANINVIQGRPAISAAGLAGIIQKTHGDNALVPVEVTNQKAVFKYKRKGWSEYATYEFTIDDARMAGIGNLQKYPKAMLRSRCISAIAQTAFQAEVGGILTGEELGGEEVSEGPILTVVEPPTVPPTLIAAAERVEAKPVLEEPGPANPFIGATQRQLRFIDGLAKEVGTSDESLREYVADHYAKEMGELTRLEASEVIEALQRILKQRQDENLVSNVKAPQSASDGPGAANGADTADDPPKEKDSRTVAMGRFFAVVGERGLSDDESRALIRKWYGHTSRGQMTEVEARQAANYIDTLSNEMLERAVLVAQGMVLDAATGEIREMTLPEAEDDEASEAEIPEVTSDLQEKAYAELIDQLEKATTKRETALVAKNYGMAHQHKLVPTDRGGVFYSALNEKNRDIEQANRAAKDTAKTAAK